MKHLKCYFAGVADDPDGHSYCAAAFAHTAKEAKMLMWQKSEFLSESCEGDFLRAYCHRIAKHDSHATGDAPYVVNDNKTLRQFGWRIEGDVSICNSCGLYEMEISPVCEECYQCDECGCDCGGES